jgi:hypothetical protein
MSAKTIALMVGLALGLCNTANADQRITPPAVPPDIELSTDYKPILVAHAIGTQNYICAPAATRRGFEWMFIGPQATGFGALLQQLLTHFPSKNPYQDDAIHATWQHSRDSSAVWAIKVAGSMDPTYVAPGAIEWLLLRVTGAQAGPTGGTKLATAVYIQRVNTIGGAKPPTSDCTAKTLLERRLVDYEADYYFYKE